MTNLRPFQIILLGAFTFMAILAVILIRWYEAPSSEDGTDFGQVVVWGSFEAGDMNDLLNALTNQDSSFNDVYYRYIDPRSFDDELVNAIAEGRSPDLIILRSDSLIKHRAKLFAISYDSISERYFRDNYVDGAEIFALADGVYALPFAVDPLVMYWNRDLFASNGLAQAPTSWEAVVGEVVPDLTIRDTSRNIIRSAVGLGEYRNIDNAKAIMMSLTMQAGSQLVSEGVKSYIVEIDKAIVPGARGPMDAALEFYTDFSNSASSLYTWNRAQPSDQNAFVSEDLAIYFGLGSEAEHIADKNPNLNFDVAPLPQGASASIERTYGDFYGFAIPKAAANRQGAFNMAMKLGAIDSADMLSRLVGMSSAYRATVAAGDPSPYRQVVLQSALISRTWLDPEPTASDQIFGEMIEDVVSNRSRVSNAVVDAVQKLTFEY